MQQQSDEQLVHRDSNGTSYIRERQGGFERYVPDRRPPQPGLIARFFQALFSK